MVAGKRRSVESHPDGGWSWMIVLSCFMVTVCTRAVTRCISIFFVEFQDHFGADYAATSWIHSLVDCTTMLCAPVGSLVGNRWSCRVAVMLGGLLSSCGLLLSSFSTSLELLYLTMGVLTGLGFALCYTPSIALVGVYFRRRRALAYGVAVSGSGIGTLVLAPAVQLLIEKYSWRGALLVLSALVANLCVCGALMRPIGRRDGEEAESAWEEAESAGEEAESVWEEKPGPGPGPGPGLVSSRDAELAGSPAPQAQRRRCFGSRFLSGQEFRFLLLPDFLVLAASFLLLASGCSLPFVYLVPYALRVGVRHQRAAFLMSILGVLDIVGNLSFGWLMDRRCLKPYLLTSYVIAVAMEGVACLVAPLLRSFALLVPFSVVYGYFDGAYVALIPVVTAHVVGARDLSSALGVVYFLHAIPYLLSPPIGGWLVDVTGSYSATFLLSGVMLLSSAAVLSVVGIRRWRRPPRAGSSPHLADQSEAVRRAAAS